MRPSTEVTSWGTVYPRASPRRRARTRWRGRPLRGTRPPPRPRPPPPSGPWPSSLTSFLKQQCPTSLTGLTAVCRSFDLCPHPIIDNVYWCNLLPSISRPKHFIHHWSAHPRLPAPACRREREIIWKVPLPWELGWAGWGYWQQSLSPVGWTSGLTGLPGSIFENQSIWGRSSAVKPSAGLRDLELSCHAIQCHTLNLEQRREIIFWARVKVHCGLCLWIILIHLVSGN